jgi:hypothetical protein
LVGRAGFEPATNGLKEREATGIEAGDFTMLAGFPSATSLAPLVSSQF